MDRSVSASDIRVETFGGLRLFLHGVEVSAGPPRQQLLFEKLLVARGRSVSLPNLIDTLWPDAPPSSAANQIHRYVGDLRRLFDSGLHSREIGRVLLPSVNGYRLDTSQLSIDLEDFYLLRDEAAARRRSNSYAESAASYTLALALAELPALSIVPGTSDHSPEESGIEKDRMLIARDAAEIALLGYGSPALLPLLERIGAGAMLNESLQARIVRCLVTYGRRADALVLYDRVRASLRDELGIDPGVELQEAHRAALSADAPGTGTGDSDQREPIRRLPPRQPGFLERSETSAALENLRLVIRSHSASSAVVSGMAGIGKTTLAVNWAHELADDFPDGQLYVNLRGFDLSGDVVSADSARDALLETLGENLTSLDRNPQVRQARYREILDARSLLIVLDNARDAEQVRPLLAGSSNSFTIVTSRSQLSGLLIRDGAATVPLVRWSDDDGRRLLSSRLNLGRTAVDNNAVELIARICAGLPLALSIMAARASTQPDADLRRIADQMDQPLAVLDSLQVDDPENNLRTVFDWSFQQLSSRAATLFSELSVHRGTIVALPVAASIAGLKADAIGPLLSELFAASMLVPLDKDEFSIHDLLRLFARERLDPAAREKAELRLVAHYVYSARSMYSVVRPDAPPDLPAQRDDTLSPAQFPTLREWNGWYQHERASLHGALDLAWEHEWWDDYSVMISGFRTAIMESDTYEKTSGYALKGLEAAEQSGRLSYVAEACREVGFRHAVGGDVPLGERYLNRALHLFQILEDERGVVRSYRILSMVAGMDKDFEMQLEYAEKGLAAARVSKIDGLLSLASSAAAQAFNSVEQWSKTIELIAEGKPATAGNRGERSGFSCEAAAALNHVGRYREAFEMTSWGLEGENPESPRMIGNLVERAYAAAELQQWDDLSEAGRHYEALLDRFEPLLREHSGGELDVYSKRVRDAVARAKEDPGSSN